MGLRVGIVGLPNVGKSTVFNALAKEQIAQVANYPFCTIQPNRAVVPVPDHRVDHLAELADRPQAIHAVVEFVDIAGLVAGASQGEGLGNQFLGQIRDTDMILHVVRCFEDPNVVHIRESPDPALDIEIVATELILADLQSLDRKIERLERQGKADRKFQPLLETAREVADHLNQGHPAATATSGATEPFKALNAELRFLTAKPVLFVANVDEAGLEDEPGYVQEVRQVAEQHSAQVVVLCARLEEALAGLSEVERQDILALAGVQTSGLEQVIRTSYRALGLISFFTMNENEVRAWTIPEGTPARQAAGIIHSDFERGFIRAEVIPYPVYARHGSSAAVKAAGEMSVEGKEYLVRDGDLIYFRFNV